MKKLMIIPFAVASLVALAGPASAHTPSVSAKCDTLTIDLKWYDDDSTVTVTIDGQASKVEFGGDYHHTYKGTKSWSVKVDNGGEGYDSKHAGTFTDCTPPSTTAPTTTVPVVEIDIPVTMTRGYLSWDCATDTASINFRNAGTKDDVVNAAGREVTVPANGDARINLDRYEAHRFFYGPVTSRVDNVPAIVDVRGAEVDGTGVVSTPCADTSSVVLSRQIEQPTQLAFTGPGRAVLLSTVASVLIFFGVMSLGLSHRTRKMS